MAKNPVELEEKLPNPSVGVTLSHAATVLAAEWGRPKLNPVPDSEMKPEQRSIEDLPAECPNNVIFAGSPPKRAILSRIQASASR